LGLGTKVLGQEAKQGEDGNKIEGILNPNSLLMDEITTIHGMVTYLK
jgi:hypothetical protein